MPEYLSDDEGEEAQRRFIQSDELPGRQYWYQLYTGRKEYNKSLIWELKDLFWITPEVSSTFH